MHRLTAMLLGTLALFLAVACSSTPPVEWEQKQLGNDDVGILMRGVEHGPILVNCADLMTEPQIRVYISKSEAPPENMRVGVVDASTSVSGQDVPVEWEWTPSGGGVRALEENAISLTQKIFSEDADNFRLEFSDFPELSQDFPVPDLERALKDADMECFG